MISVTTRTYFQLLSDLLAKEGAGADCYDGCPYFLRYENVVPYGNTTVSESLWECECPETYACSRVNQLLEEE